MDRLGHHLDHQQKQHDDFCFLNYCFGRIQWMVCLWLTFFLCPQGMLLFITDMECNTPSSGSAELGFKQWSHYGYHAGANKNSAMAKVSWAKKRWEVFFHSFWLRCQNVLDQFEFFKIVWMKSPTLPIFECGILQHLDVMIVSVTMIMRSPPEHSAMLSLIPCNDDLQRWLGPQVHNIPQSYVFDLILSCRISFSFIWIHSVWARNQGMVPLCFPWS